MIQRHIIASVTMALVVIAAIGAGLRLQHSSSAAPAGPVTPAATAAQFSKSAHSFDDPASLWVVVNKQRSLQPAAYIPADLVEVANNQRLRSPAAAAARQLMNAAQAAGAPITVESAYRSYEQQKISYQSEVEAYGQAQADAESARPGYSEHQTGWAVDFGSGGCHIGDCFVSTPGGAWTAAHAHEYGFILRYPEGKSDVTGYRHESWHFRYVGRELADEMRRSGTTTLEEFFGLPPAPTYK